MANVPFYFADVLITEEDEQISNTYFFSDLKQFEVLSLDSRISLTNIYVVTPPYVNKSNLWKMDAVSKVSVGIISEDGFDSEITIFELKNGFKYYSSDIDEKVERIENIESLISIAD